MVEKWHTNLKTVCHRHKVNLCKHIALKHNVHVGIKHIVHIGKTAIQIQRLTLIKFCLIIFWLQQSRHIVAIANACPPPIAFGIGKIVTRCKPVELTESVGNLRVSRLRHNLPQRRKRSNRLFLDASVHHAQMRRVLVVARK